MAFAPLLPPKVAKKKGRLGRPRGKTGRIGKTGKTGIPVPLVIPAPRSRVSFLIPVNKSGVPIRGWMGSGKAKKTARLPIVEASPKEMFYSTVCGGIIIWCK